MESTSSDTDKIAELLERIEGCLQTITPAHDHKKCNSYKEDLDAWIKIFGDGSEGWKDTIMKREECFINKQLPDQNDLSLNSGKTISKLEIFKHENEFHEFIKRDSIVSTSDGDHDHKKVAVIIRDFIKMDCSQVLKYKRSLGMKKENLLGNSTNKDMPSASRLKNVFEGTNVDGNGEYPAAIQRLTPRLTELILSIFGYEAEELDWEPAISISEGILTALKKEPICHQHYQDIMNHQVFDFTAVFFELVGKGSSYSTIYDPSDQMKRLGSKWNTSESNFTLWNESEFKIQERTLSLVFDSIKTEKGSYWTIISIGEFSEHEAYDSPPNGRLEQAEFTTPEEIYLAKIARMINWVVDNGMSKVLDHLMCEIEDPAEVLLSEKKLEKKLFGDEKFTSSKKLNYALQWLRMMTERINGLLAVIHDFERVPLETLRKNARDHKYRYQSGEPEEKHTKPLVSEKTFRLEKERTLRLKKRIETKYAEIRYYRDALVNTSGVLSSRAALSEAESMRVLTLVMIVFLPITTVISVFGMSILPESVRSPGFFGMITGLVFFTTTLLSLNLGSFSLVAIKCIKYVKKLLRTSMKQVGMGWGGRSKDLEDTVEIEKLQRNGDQGLRGLWYIWYCITWLVVVFPGTELRRLGGAKDLVREKSVGLLTIAKIPLTFIRIVLLPMHMIIIAIDFLLLLIFPRTIFGYDRKQSKKDRAEEKKPKSFGDWICGPIPILNALSGSLFETSCTRQLSSRSVGQSINENTMVVQDMDRHSFETTELLDRAGNQGDYQGISKVREELVEMNVPNENLGSLRLRSTQGPCASAQNSSIQLSLNGSPLERDLEEGN
ncbi:hypothetical protein RUND412_008929, partial [Rhizina undulata]